MEILLLSSSFLLAIFYLIICKRFFEKNGMVVKINKRSSHHQVATNSGGTSLFFTLFTISTIFYLFGIELFEYKYLVPISLITFIGLYDDVNQLNFKLKFIFQIICAKIIVDTGLIIENLHGFLGVYEISSLIAQLLSIFIIVSILNAVNFIDGIDGLASSLFILFLISFEFFSSNYFYFDYLTIILISGIIPILILNFKRDKKVFLGDSGSLMIGSIISIYVLSILSNEYIINQAYDMNKILFVLIILFYPIIDLVRIFLIRVLNGKSPFLPDRNHLHHKILDNFKSHGITTLIIIVASLLIIILSQLINNFI